MCWHAHMLSPHIFDQDCDGAYSLLAGRRFPLAEIAAAIREHSLTEELDVDHDHRGYTLSTTKWDPLDVAEAVIRQIRFVQNAALRQWFNPELIEGRNERQIDFYRRSIMRYHAFLDLMKAHDNRCFLVPLRDIDLVWHTHQLMGKRYKFDTEDILGIFLNHNDNVGETKLNHGLKDTEKLWKERFGYDYL